MLLVIVDNLHVIGVTILPFETDPPLIIDSDAVLTRSPTSQPFEAVSRRYAEISEAYGGIQNSKLTECNSLNTPSQLPNRLTLE